MLRLQWVVRCTGTNEINLKFKVNKLLLFRYNQNENKVQQQCVSIKEVSSWAAYIGHIVR